MKRKILLFATVVMILLGVGITSWADVPIWPMYKQNPQGTGYTPYLGPREEPGIMWEFKLDLKRTFRYPIVTDRDRVYIGSEEFLYALDGQGKEVWRFNFEDGEGTAALAIGPDGTIYAARGYYECGSEQLNNGYVVAVSSDGAKKWKSLPIWIYLPWHYSGKELAVDENGSIYFNNHYALYVIAPNGTIKWKWETDDPPHLHTFRIGLDGTIYIIHGNVDDSIIALSPNGEVKWSKPIDSGGLVVSESTLYLTRGGEVFAWTLQGEEKWRFSAKNNIPPLQKNEKLFTVRSRLMAANGRIYLELTTIIHLVSPFDNSHIDKTTYLHKLYALQAKDGKKLWEMDFSDSQSEISLVAIDRDGTLYCGDEDKIYAVSTDGQVKWECGRARISNIIIGPNETLLAIDPINKKLYALGNGRDVLPAYDFFILNVDISPAQAGGEIIKGDSVSLSALIRDNNFTDYKVKFIDLTQQRELEEVKPKSLPGANSLANLRWQIDNKVSLGKHRIKIIVDPENEIQETNETNNEYGIQIEVKEKAEKGFYWGIPPAGEKKIGVIVFYNPELNPKKFDLILNSENRFSIYYAEHWFAEQSQKHTGKSLISIKVDLITLSPQKLPFSANPTDYMKSQTIKKGTNLDKYDIVACIYIYGGEHESWEMPDRWFSGHAIRSERTTFQVVLYDVGLEEGSYYRNTNTFLHEIMHIFGANDHYRGFAVMQEPDIMNQSHFWTINKYTAQEIGWADRNHDGIIDAEEPELYAFHGPSDLVKLTLKNRLEKKFTLNLKAGLNLISVPLNDPRVKRLSDLRTHIGPNLGMIVAYDQETKKFVTFTSDTPENSPLNKKIRGDEAYFVQMKSPATVTFEGQAWDGRVNLVPGINLIALPVKPANEMRLSDLMAKINPSATMAIWYSEEGEFVSYLPDRSVDSPANAVLEGGRGYIILMKEANTLTFKGEAWENDSVQTAPQKTREVKNETEIKKLLKQLQQLIALAEQTLPFEVVPPETLLLQNFPNPFNPDTWIPFKLANDATINISIYNARGQLVRKLNLGSRKAGAYITKERAAYWDGRNEIGERVASGVYFYTLRAGNFSATRRMVILK